MDYDLISHVWHRAMLYYSVLDHFIWGAVFWIVYKVKGRQRKKQDATFEEQIQKLWIEFSRLKTGYPHFRPYDDYSEDDEDE